MAKKEKKYFGSDETKVDSAHNETTGTAKRKYTRRAKINDLEDVVTIQIPRSLAFQIGKLVGASTVSTQQQ